MSKQVDERVVEMRFDNSNFESNVKTTMSTLDRLKAALKFPSKTDALNTLAAGAKNATNGIGNVNASVGRLQASFSALQVVGVTALANITNSAVNAGKRLVSALTVEPMLNGLSEYELQMNSIQTILANTKSKGTTLDQVNAALDELNTYADKTIYNFAQMTHNIGTFTAAGVDLDTAVASIKGISNLAAMSGSSASQAATAMYQLSQAIAAGRVSLMDWNSVVNAGMGGEQFQNALKRTAEHFGTDVDGMIAKYGSFRESLTRGQWLTADVLTETLKQISGAYTEADLIAQGYTEDQARAITQMAQDAENAATNITTFSKLIETAGESLGSGWAQTWQAIFGDFETAKAFWSDLWNNYISPLIDGMSDARNALIGGAMDMGGSGGWDALSSKITEAGVSLDTFQQTLSQVVSEQGGSLDSLIEKYGSLGAAMTSGEISGDMIVESLKRIANAADDTGTSTEDLNSKLNYFQDVVDRVWRGDFKNAPERYQLLAEAGYDYAEVQDLVNKTVDGHRLTLEDLSDVQLKSIGYTQEQIDTIHNLANEAEKAGTPLNELINSLSKKSGRELFFESIKNIIQAIVTPLKAISDAFNSVFGMDSSQLYGIIAAFNEFSKAIIMNETDATNLMRTLRGVFSVVHLVATTFGKTFTLAIKAANAVLAPFGTNVLGLTAFIGDIVYGFDQWISSGNLVESMLDGLGSAVSFLITPLRNFWDSLFPDDVIASDDNLISKVVEAFDALRSYIESFDGLDPGQVFVKLSDDINNFFKSFTWDDFLSSLSDIGEQIRRTLSKTVDDVKEIGPDIIEGLQNGLSDGLDGIIKAAQELGSKIVEAVKALLGIHSPSTVFFEIGKNIIQGLCNGIKFMVGELVGVASYLVDQLSGVFAKVDWGVVLGIAGGVGAFVILNKFVTALNTAATALKNISDPFLGLGQIFGGIAGVMKSFSKYLDEKKWTVRANAVKTLAISLGILAASIVVLANVPVDGLERATNTIIVLAGTMALLVLAINQFAGTQSLDTLKISGVLVSIGIAFGLMAATMAILSGISPDGAQQALTFIEWFGLIVVALMGMTQFMGKASKLEQMSSFLTGIGASFLMMGVTVKLLGSVNSGQMDQALNAISMFGLIITALMGMTKFMGKGKTISQLSSMLKSVGVAFLAMTAVVKLIGGTDATSLAKGLTVITYFTGIIVGLMAATKLTNGKGLNNVGTTILAASGSLILMAGAAKIIGSMSVEELNKGVTYISIFAGIIAALMGITKLMGGGEVAKVGATILAMSASIAIIAGVAVVLGMIEIENLAKGITAVGILSLIVDGMVMATKNAKDVKGTMVGIAIAIGVLAASIAVLSFIEPEKLATASGALSAVLLGLAAVTKAASSIKIDKNMVATFATMGLILAGVTGVIYILSGIDSTNALPNALGLSALLIALSASMKLMSGMTKDTKIDVGAITTLTLVMYALSGVIAILSTIDATSTIPNAVALSALLLALSGATAILGTIKGSIDTTALASMGILTAIVAALAGILYAIRDVNPANSIPNVVALGTLLTALTAVTAIFGTLKVNIASAAEGAAALSAVGAIIGTVIGIVGAINSAVGGGMASAVASAIPVLENLGTAIGSFIGNLVGSIAGGAIESIGSSLEQFGLSLSTFMVNLTPFLTGLRTVTPEMGTALSNLAGAILILTGADILDGIARFLGGGVDWGGFGSKLSTLGDGLKDFGNAIADVDTTQVSAGARALKTVTTAMSQIPSEGGLLGALLGGKNYTGFADGLTSMGNALVAFDDTTANITPDGIQPKADALSTIIRTMSEIPETGGLLGALLGGKDYSGFAEGMANIGEGLKKFYFAAAYIVNPDLLTNATNALSDLITALSQIPTSGGFLDGLIGDGEINYDNFAGGLASIGYALRDFYDAISEISNPGLFGTIVSASKTLIEGLASINMDNGGGLFGQMMQVNGTTFTGFSTSLVSLGNALSSFAGSIVDADFSNMFGAVNSARQILEFVNETASIDTSGVESFKNAVNSLADANISKMIDTFSTASGQLTGVGSGLIKSVADGIGQNASSVAKAAQQAVTDAASAVSEKYGEFNDAGVQMATEMANGVNDTASQVSDAAGNAVNGARQAASDLVAWNFWWIGTQMAAGLRDGIMDRAHEVANAAAQMVRDAMNAANSEAQVNSPSKKFYRLGEYCGMGLTNALDDYRSYAYKSGQSLMRSTIDGVSGLTGKIDNYISSAFDTDSAPTIRPVMDLSDVKNGVDYINSAITGSSTFNLLGQARRINRSLGSRRQNGTTDDVIRELSRLRNDIQQMPVNQYTVNGITYDDGSAIAGAVGQLIRTTRLERRI